LQTGSFEDGVLGRKNADRCISPRGYLFIVDLICGGEPSWCYWVTGRREGEGDLFSDGEHLWRREWSFWITLFIELLAGGLKEWCFVFLLITGFLKPSSCRRRLPYYAGDQMTASTSNCRKHIVSAWIVLRGWSAERPGALKHFLFSLYFSLIFLASYLH